MRFRHRRKRFTVLPRDHHHTGIEVGLLPADVPQLLLQPRDLGIESRAVTAGQPGAEAVRRYQLEQIRAVRPDNDIGIQEQYAVVQGVASRYVQKLVTRRGEVALGNVREGLPSWTTCSIPYPIENMCVSDDHRLTHSRTPW